MSRTTRQNATFLAGSFSDPDLGMVAQHVFGQVVKRATPVVTAYHSDFFHDALWIKEYVVGQEFTFFYAFNDSGTSIGTDREAVTAYRENKYEVTAFIDEGSGWLRITDLMSGEVV